MAQYFHTPLAASSASASAEGPGFPASNVLLPEVLRAWKSTDTSSHWLEIDLGSNQTVAAIVVSETNASSITVKADTVTPASANSATLTTSPDATGRRRGRHVFNVTARYIRLEFSGTPSDGLGYWRLGAVHVFAASASLPRAPRYGLRLRYIQPQQLRALPNGRQIRWDTGAGFCELSGQFKGVDSDDMEGLLLKAKSEICALELDGRGEWVWPVTATEDVQRTIERYNGEVVPFVLRERV